MTVELRNPDQVGYAYTDVLGTVEISVEEGLLLNLDGVVVDDYRILVGDDDDGNPCIALLADGSDETPDIHLDGDTCGYVYTTSIRCDLNTSIDYENGVHMTLGEAGCEFGAYDANVVEIYVRKNASGNIDGFLFQFLG